MWTQVFQFLSVFDLLRIVRRVKCMKNWLSMYGGFSVKKWLCTGWLSPTSTCIYPTRESCDAKSTFFVHIVLKLATSDKKRQVLLHSSGWSTRHNKVIEMFLEPTHCEYMRKNVSIRKSVSNSDATFVAIGGFTKSARVWFDHVTNTHRDDGADCVWRSEHVVRWF